MLLTIRTKMLNGNMIIKIFYQNISTHNVNKDEKEIKEEKDSIRRIRYKEDKDNK